MSCKSTAALATSKIIQLLRPIAMPASTAFSKAPTKFNRPRIRSWLMKRAVAGRLALLPAIKRIMDEVVEPSAPAEGSRRLTLAAERKLLAAAKKLTLFASGAASQKHMQDLQDQQEIMGALADCVMEVYALESCLLRTEKLINARSESSAKNAIAMTRFYAARAIQIVEASAKKAIVAVAEGDVLRTQLAILRRLGKYEPPNIIALGRQIAKHIVSAGRYTL